MKKIILASLFFLCASFIFSKDFRFSCPFSDIPEASKGEYFFETDNYSLFYTTTSHERINIVGLMKDCYTSQFSYDYNPGFLPGAHETDFFRFDKNGNAFVILRHHELTQHSFIIIKYDPVNNEVTSFNLGKNFFEKSFTISDDGKWIFVEGIKDYNENTMGSPTVLAYPVNNPGDCREIVAFDIGIPVHDMILNLCFDSNTKCLYFYYNGWNEVHDASIKQGLYILNPDTDGSYSSKGLSKIVYPMFYRFEQYVNYEKRNNLPDHSFTVKRIKDYCGLDVDYDSIVFSLAHFKTLQNTEFKALYKEDEKGEPLTESRAVEHLMVENLELFRDYCWSYGHNIGNNGYVRIFPVDYLCLDKNTGMSAVKGDRAFLKNRALEENGFLFSNDEGVWFNAHRTVNNSFYSTLFKIADEKGNIVTEINEDLSSILLGSVHDREIDVYAGKDFLTFLPEDNHTIYMYKNDSVYDMSYLFPEVTEFTKEHLKIVMEKQEAERIAAMAEVPAAESETELKEVRTYSLRTVIILSVLLILVAISLLILIFITVIMPSINRTLQDKAHLLRIKKDKKYIFDIQEKERGKISRDIHDSIIQDIRAIRINAELINVNAEDEERKQKVINLATDCVVNLRNICYNLTPAELATHADGDTSKIELISIIQTLVTQFIEKTHVPCSIQIEENFSYPVFEKETSQNLFRIIQEALTNIEKHSYATTCSIYIKEKEAEGQKFMQVYISDDGVGCDINKLLNRRKKLHFGLHNMLDRADLIGANLKFRSEQGDGMEIIISIPIK